MFTQKKLILFSVVMGMLFAAGLMLFSQAIAAPAWNSADHRPAAVEHHVCLAGPPDCDFATIQEAVDGVAGGDTIKVAAGNYSGVNNMGGLAQVVYINKSLTIQGGYTLTNWTTPNLEANPTVVDAQGLGRGFYITGTISPTLTYLEITGGNATGLGPTGSGGAGGGIYVFDAFLTLDHCVIANNIASTSTVKFSYGGGVFVDEGQLEMSDTMIVSNTASTGYWGFGGGMCLIDSTLSMADSTLQGNTASTAHPDRAAKGHGGGLFFDSTPATFSGNTITANTANQTGGGYGGGIYGILSEPVVFDGDTVLGNIASKGGGGIGGGLYFEVSRMTLDGITLQDNIAGYTDDGDGGGMYANSSPFTLKDSLVKGNIAGQVNGDGGGVYIYNTFRPQLNDNIIQDNIGGKTGPGIGGGVYSSDSSGVLLSGNTIQGNVASLAHWGACGGLVSSNGGITLEGNLIISNTATFSDTIQGIGGGLCGWQTYTRMTNNIVARNYAHTQGSGMHFEGTLEEPGRGYMIHNTIADNYAILPSAYGFNVDSNAVAGITLDDYVTLAFTNTIISGHEVGMQVISHSVATLEGTLWYANGTDTGGSGTINLGAINLKDDPAYVGGADYHLTAASAALDEGVNAGVEIDIDGQQRPQGSGYDIGADEYYPYIGMPIYLPLIIR
jgi:hypothetical protein